MPFCTSGNPNKTLKRYKVRADNSFDELMTVTMIADKLTVNQNNVHAFLIENVYK